MSLQWSTIDAPRRPITSTALQQHPAYAAACSGLGCETVWLEATENGRPVASALAVTRRIAGLLPVAMVARGPVWADQLPLETRTRVLALLPKALGCRNRLTLVSPDDTDARASALAGYTRAAAPVSLARLGLLGGPSDLRARQSVKWRNRLRRAEQGGITISRRAFSADRDRWLLQAEAAQRRTRGYRGLPLPFVLSWVDGTPDATLILTARHRGQRIAAMLFLLHFPGASYHIGWSGPEGRKLNAHNLLLWQAAQWLAGECYTTADLGRLDPCNTPGLDRFKLGAGATATPTGATFLRAPLTRTAGHITGRIAQARKVA